MLGPNFVYSLTILFVLATVDIKIVLSSFFKIISHDCAKSLSLDNITINVDESSFQHL